MEVRILVTLYLNVNVFRHYEERELRNQQERAKKRMEFDSQIDRITSNLEFERSRDTQSKSTEFLLFTTFLKRNIMFWDEVLRLVVFPRERASLGAHGAGRRR